MGAAALFPVGTDGQRHILPHQEQFLLSGAKYKALIGGYGAGKTVPACVYGVLLSTEVPGNMGVVCRRSYQKLHDSTQRIFLEVCARTGADIKALDNRGGFPHRLIFPNGSEVHFRETKDMGRWLGQEYGWFYVDEAAEEPKTTWLGLMSRLRLPRASKWLTGMLTSNPPDVRHWIAQVFGETPGERIKAHTLADGTVETTTFHLIQVASAANPHIPAGYLADLEQNNSPAEVRRILNGQYGFSFEGKPVFSPPFAFEQHVDEFMPSPITLVRSWDWGFHVPCVLWHQFPSCRSGRVHWHVHREYVGQDIEAEQLADVVLEKTRDWFPQCRSVIDCGDHAGRQVNDKGPGPIIRLHKPPWNLVFRSRRLPIEPGLALIRQALGTVCACGRPRLIVDRRCKTLIDTLAGGYHYEKIRYDHALKEKPVKDGLYDNVADALRYCGENVWRPYLAEPPAVGSTEVATPAGFIEPDRSDWMGGWGEVRR